MDKFKNIYRKNKKLLLVLFIITIIGIISGSLFITILNNDDKQLVINSLTSFFDDIKNNNMNYKLALRSGLITNFVYIFIIWLLGISIIGIPIVLLMFFIKNFILGFTLVSIISNYGFRGVIYSFIYIFPHNVINILIWAILTLYALKYSFCLLYAFLKKKTIDFKVLFNKYRYVLIISILCVLITSLYHVFVMPNILKVVLKLLK